MKVTILTVYSKPNIVDKIEKLILSMNTQEPQTFTEVNIDKGEGNLTAEWFHPDLGDKNLDTGNNYTVRSVALFLNLI